MTRDNNLSEQIVNYLGDIPKCFCQEDKEGFLIWKRVSKQNFSIFDKEGFLIWKRGFSTGFQQQNKTFNKTYQASLSCSVPRFENGGGNQSRVAGWILASFLRICSRYNTLRTYTYIQLSEYLLLTRARR